MNTVDEQIMDLAKKNGYNFTGMLMKLAEEALVARQKPKQKLEQKPKQKPTVSIKEDPFIKAIICLIETNGDWEGSGTELLKTLNKTVSSDTKRKFMWPKQPNKLSGMLSKAVPILNKENIEIERSKSGSRKIAIRRILVDLSIPRHVNKANKVELARAIRTTMDELCSLNGTADALHIAPATVQKYLYKGRLEAKKLVDELISKGVVFTVPEAGVVDYEGPEGLLTEDTIEALDHYKWSVISVMRQYGACSTRGGSSHTMAVGKNGITGYKARKTLKECGGNKTAAAASLGVCYLTFCRWLMR